MIFKILLRYILGYVNISIQGYYIERFINACTNKNIFLWNVKTEKTTYATANVGINDFKKLKEITRKTKCRMEINKKYGLPFLMNRYRKRKIFFVLLLLIVIFMYIESKFIWNIEVQGLNTIPETELKQELEENGLKVRNIKI